MTPARPRTLTGLTVLLALAAGCSPATPASPASTPPPAAPPATAQPASAGATASTAPASTAPASTVAWPSGPVTVRHDPAVPPIPVVTRIRYGTHPGYDRIVFDIGGELPSYTARYVSEVRADGSGERVAVPGRRYLLVALNPAQAHREDGTATVTGVHRTGLRTIQAYAVAGDYEGYVSIALGLDRVAGYRIGELPGRIYLDVAH